ncbi:hypothetical protein CBS63078_9731 [Aspergillus niger]|nr:hypothetical protein CBS133816_4810 [Aspergillus niger]KAI2846988.1 hypothetical protein CBS11350_3519 [Aspergillus niger]KAI2865913.1 hypothetical protein CBS12448_1832 [Aspergillus niger]KAI2872302.1 hypothetical protein CBS13152_9998 [Aspergillus niger]KAI2891348.1 hypothetical protein CBS63078_9731 [Aspergillus niger]
MYCGTLNHIPRRAGDGTTEKNRNKQETYYNLALKIAMDSGATWIMNAKTITVYTTLLFSLGKAEYFRWPQYGVPSSAIYLTLTGANDLNGRSQSELYTEYGVENSPSTDGHGLCMQCDEIN